MESSGKLLWLLDVDGVLGVDDPDPRVHIRHRLRAGGWPVDIWVDPDVPRRINEFVDQYDVRLVWLTTWSWDAVDELAPRLSLDPRAEVLPQPEMGSLARRPGEPSPWWKHELARRFVAAEKPAALVWTDDDLDASVRATCEQEWSFQQLLLTPDARTGLTEIDLTRIGRFFASSS